MSKSSGNESSAIVHGGRVLRQRIDNGEVLWGLLVTLPAPGILELAKDWDWFWIDGQHGQLSYDTILNCVRVADLVGVPAIVRVAGHDYSQIGPVLDTGAAGVLVPMLHNAEQAKAVVKAAKFTPLGQRSYGGRRMLDRYGVGYYRTANDDSLLLVQIESVEGFSNAEQIAAVPGIDGLFFGPTDYALDRGISKEVSANMSEPHLWEVAEKIAKICRKHGKIACVHADYRESSGRWVGLGYQMSSHCTDATLLQNAATKALAELRQVAQKALGGI